MRGCIPDNPPLGKCAKRANAILYAREQGRLDTEHMSTRFTITLALAAGFMGGLATRYLRPTPVYAQAPAAPQEVRAQKFVLVDENGIARGVFGIEVNGTPAIEMIDANGDVFAAEFGKMVVCIWSRQAVSPRSEASYSATDQTMSPSVSEGCYKPTTKGWCFSPRSPIAV
jgi:hypothetical protein